MKTASLPPLRVEPKLKKSIELVLEEGESVSSFMLKAITHTAQLRWEQRGFLRKAEARSRHAERTGKYVPADAVYKRLEQILARAKKRATKR